MLVTNWLLQRRLESTTASSSNDSMTQENRVKPIKKSFSRRRLCFAKGVGVGRGVRSSDKMIVACTFNTTRTRLQTRRESESQNNFLTSETPHGSDTSADSVTAQTSPREQCPSLRHRIATVISRMSSRRDVNSDDSSTGRQRGTCDVTVRQNKRRFRLNPAPGTRRGEEGGQGPPQRPIVRRSPKTVRSSLRPWWRSALCRRRPEGSWRQSLAPGWRPSCLGREGRARQKKNNAY